MNAKRQRCFDLSGSEQEAETASEASEASEAEQVNEPDQFMPNAAIASPTSSPASSPTSPATPPQFAALEPIATPTSPTAAEQQQDWGWALRGPNFKGRDRLCGTFVRHDDGFLSRGTFD